MCPPPEPCCNYRPNMEAARGHLCFGMGYSPPCRNCGASEASHQWWDLDYPEIADE